MPIGTGLALGIAGLSGLAGAAGSHSSQSQSIDAGEATNNEFEGQNGMMNAYRSYGNMVNFGGPGQSDVAAGTDATRQFAQMLKQYSQNGAGPNADDISQGNSLAKNIFAPQQTALSQSFTDQGVAADRQAALMGRSVNDPILQAKLRTEQMRQSAMLGAQQGSFATQYAMQQPMQRLGFAQQHAGVMSGLATQAMQNRQALAAMGEGIMNNERQFRLATATRTQNQQSGGGLGGAITGFLGGAGSGMNLANAMGLSSFGQGTSSFKPYAPGAEAPGPYASPIPFPNGMSTIPGRGLNTFQGPMFPGAYAPYSGGK